MFSHKRLHGLDSDQLQELMFQEKGVNWNNYSAVFKRGVYIARTVVETPFTPKALAELPPKHAAHKDPNLTLKRVVVTRLALPPLVKIHNRVDVLLRGASPQTGMGLVSSVAA